MKQIRSATRIDRHDLPPPSSCRPARLRVLGVGSRGRDAANLGRGARADTRSGRYVHAGDAEMFLQEEGPPKDRPFLLVHGTGAWSEIWRGTMHSLGAAGYRAIA